jgi:raffinose/stachyose/melibiose transport system substrate-binding protein
MKSKLIFRILCLAMVLTFILCLAACGAGSGDGTAKDSSTKAAGSETDSGASAKKGEPVTISFLSNNPDRSSGIGKHEQMVIDKYMAENPNVKIEVEALQDEAYKQKFKAYQASNSLPDVYFVWGFPAQFKPIAAGGYAAELNPQDFADYGFFPGTLDPYTIDGKLYGLPKSVDITVLYYNKKLFADNGIKVPETFQELIEAAKAFRAKGIAPCAQNGKERWNMAILYHDIAVKVAGNQEAMFEALDMKTSFKDSADFLEAANLFKDLMDVKFYQDSFTTADYGTARNLFGQGKAAMYYMGSWEGGLASDPNFSDEFKQNIGVMSIPAIEGGKGKSTDILGWSSGLSVYSKSKNLDASIELLKFWFKPENHTKLYWEMGLGLPAQNYDAFVTGNETEVQKQLTQILSSSTSISICAWNDYLTPAFKTDVETAIQALSMGLETPEAFVDIVDKLIAENQ